MRIPTPALTAVIFVAGACSSVSDRVAAHSEPALPGPASWQGPLADRMNCANLAPLTPALRSFKGRAPLVHLARTPDRAAAGEPAYEVAVFDDGTMVYEGHRCVRIGGLVLARLAPDDLVRVRDLLAALCLRFEGINEGELCDDAVSLRLTCASGERAHTVSDHCRKQDAQGRRIEALRAGLVESLELEVWLGEPTDRQACTPGARDLAPHELARTLDST
jgi:hypothetical protein